MKKIILLSFVLCSFLSVNAAVQIQKAEGWLESAFVEWTASDSYSDYNVYVRPEGGNYTALDKQLLRNYGTYFRADALGLPAGNYQLKVVPIADGAEVANEAVTTDVLSVRPHNRNGFAHFNWNKGIGAYKDNGELKDDARVLYVHKGNAKTITLDMLVDADKNIYDTRTGIQDIIQAYEKGAETRPLCVRLIGMIEAGNLDYMGSSEEGLQIKGKKADQELNLTIEGVGNDAVIRGFGILVRNSKSLEIRNMAVMTLMDDGVSLDTDNSNIWLHHIDGFYGKNGGGDHAKGDGTIDVKSDSKYVTVSYCHFWDTGKTNMFGMKSESGPNYISYHHNWFDHSDSRHPRVRTMSVHVYNNYFDGIAKYCVGATTGSSVFVEANYFNNAHNPMLISMQGSDTQNGTIKGTFSSEDGGIIKAYNNVFAGSSSKPQYYSASNTEHFDAYLAQTRSEQVPGTVKAKQGGSTYNNFDTNSSLMPAITPDDPNDIPAIVTGDYGAGRMFHSDITFSLANFDPADSEVSSALSNLITGYTSKLQGIFGTDWNEMPVTRIRVHTIGDSTMAEYDESTTDKRGWAMYLASFFDAKKVTVNNRAKSGADTRGFYTGAAYWPSVKSQMSDGDYLLIQFAHNDEGTVTYGMDNLEYAAYCSANGLPAPTDARGTNPQTTYRDYLRLFIDEARALGVTPVLVGPICRAYFQGNNIKRNGQHDLGDKFSKIENGVLLENQSLPAGDSTMSYVKAMKVVAAEENVPFIDLTEATRKLYLSYGETQCLNLLFCEGDKTHTNAMGGNLVARAAAQLLKDADVLAEYITIPTDITANPGAIAIGDAYCGVAQNKEFLLTGYTLEPADGTVALSATANLQLSLDKVNYASTANATYSGGSLFQRIYVRANYTTRGEQRDTVYAKSGEHVIAIPVSANAILQDGGETVRATWAIDARPVPDAVVEGPISATFTMQHMIAADTKPDFSDGNQSGITMVRFHNADDSGTKTAWPANEIDENATRYIDFAITAPDATDVCITGISMDIAAHSTSTMCYHINAGFGDGFTGVKTLAEKVNMTNLAIEHLALTPTLTIHAGQTLHVRVLPWHKHSDAKSGKYICLKNVIIEGQVLSSTPSGVEEIVKSSNPQIVKYIKDGQLIIIRDGIEYTILGHHK